MESAEPSGHAMRNELGKPATLALFSGHNGELDADLSDLGFFHLVRIVADGGLAASRGPLTGIRRGEGVWACLGAPGWNNETEAMSPSRARPFQ